VGEGDTFGQPVAHGVAAGMGGLRTAGDLVARLQLTRGLRLPEAKRYVAGKLGVTVDDLSDPVAMYDVRRALGLGTYYDSQYCGAQDPNAIEAKFHIADVLDLPINCVQRFRRVSAPRRVGA
jgi:dimethylamine---corrinoid protein Co-methyltransferase